MFSRNYRLDDESLFTTTRALRRTSASSVGLPVQVQWKEWNALVAIMGLSLDILGFLFDRLPLGRPESLALAAAIAALTIFTSKLPLQGALLLTVRLRRYLWFLLWAILSALLAITAIDLYAMLVKGNKGNVLGVTVDDVVNWCGSELAAMPPKVVAVLLLLNLRPPRIANLANSASGRKLLLGAKVVLSIWLISYMASQPWGLPYPFNWYYSFLGRAFTILVLSISSIQDAADGCIDFWIDTFLHICFVGEIFTRFSIVSNGLQTFLAMLVMLLMGNLQIPAAVARVVLSSSRLHMVALAHRAYPKGSNPNLVPSLLVFYVMVLCQGTFYIVACILEIFSFFLRRSLAHHSGFRGQWGVRAIDLYYQRVYTTCMETGVFAQGNMISLVSFAIKSLGSCSHEFQLAGVRVLDSLLQRRRDSSKELITSEVTKSNKAVTILIGMLGRTAVRDKHIRLFAARVTAELASSLRIAVVPGLLSLVSSLLDAEKQPAEQPSLSLVAHGSKNDGMNIGDSPSGRSSSAQATAGDEIAGGNVRNEPSMQDHLSQAAGANEESSILVNQLAGQESSEQSDYRNGENEGNRPARGQSVQEGNAGLCHWLHQRWRLIKEMWSFEEELPVTHQDSLPVLGMQILERLAYDLGNRSEISRATGLISNIIELISYSIVTANSNEEQQKALACLSLNLLRNLANTGEKIGSELRRELWANPLLLHKLAGIMEDSRSGPEVWEPAMDIIAKLAWDEEARQEIGSAQVITGKLMHAFLGRRGEDTSMYYDQPLRMVAGEALAYLSIGSAANCSAILKEPGYDVIKDLKDMLCGIEYRYLAASIIKSLCTHCTDELRRHSSREQLSSALPMVSLSHGVTSSIYLQIFSLVVLKSINEFMGVTFTTIKSS